MSFKQVFVFITSISGQEHPEDDVRLILPFCKTDFEENIETSDVDTDQNTNTKPSSLYKLFYVKHYKQNIQALYDERGDVIVIKINGNTMVDSGQEVIETRQFWTSLLNDKEILESSKDQPGFLKELIYL